MSDKKIKKNLIEEGLFIGKWPENFTDEQKEMSTAFLKQSQQEKTRLCVIYNPNCGCSIDQLVVLDRYPMSPKIISIGEA